MLEAARINGLQVIAAGMVGRPIEDIAKIERLRVERLQCRQVRIVRHQLVDVGQKRVRHGIGRRLRELANQCAVSGAGFEHAGWPATAAGLEIQREGDILGPGMLVHEGTRTKQTGFFPVREEQDHIVLKRRWSDERACRL